MNSNHWCFILGGSSGFGLAAAKIFADKGYNLFLVHRDRKMRLTELDIEFELIRKKGVQLISVNCNINDKNNEPLIVKKLKDSLVADGKIKVFLHSVADGNIGYLVENENIPHQKSLFCKNLTEDSFAYTIQSMGTSFISWSKLLAENNFLTNKSRIIGLTSEGTSKVLTNYAAVAAAKSVLESACKYLAVELAPLGITTNLINAGITDTNALKIFPGYNDMIDFAKKRNPMGRMTTPEDVAKVIYLLSTDDADWINGTIIRVDGGEQIVGF